MALSELARAKIRLECARIIYQCGSDADRNDVATKSERIYNFVVGNNSIASENSAAKGTGSDEKKKK